MALSFGVGFAALNTGNNLLYLVLSLMLAFLVLSGVLSESSLRGIRVRRRLPRELFAGTPNIVGLEVSNTQRRVSAFAIVVEDLHLDASAGRTFALRIAPGGTERRVYRLSPPRRGPLEFTGFRVYTRFPFGLFAKSLALEAPERTLVYPAIEPVTVPAHMGNAVNRAERDLSLIPPAPRSQSHAAEVSGLRDYAHGDPMRRVHWPASLRRGSLVVREVEADREQEIEIRLRTQGTQPGESFERRVRWAASEIVAFLENGARVALRTDAEHIPAAAGAPHRARLLAFLAVVEPAS